MTDWAEKLDGLRGGDLAATNEVISLVTRYLVRIGGFEYRDSWDDFVQEILISLVQKPPRSREPGAIVRHIQTTCRRRYIDEIRRSRGRRRRNQGDEDGLAGWRRNVSLDELDVPEMADPFWPKQLDLGVRSALELLEDPKRRALEAVYLLGLTYEEASVQLETPLGTLKGHLKEALGELRELLSIDYDEFSSGSPGSSVSSVETSGLDSNRDRTRS